MKKSFVFKKALLFGIIGSLLGGFLFGLTMPTFIILTTFLGFFYGFVPAFLVGLILMFLDAKKDDSKSYSLMLITGGILSVIFGLLIEFLDGNFTRIDGVYWDSIIQTTIIFGMSGTVSSVITGSIILPKSVNKDISNEIEEGGTK